MAHHKSNYESWGGRVLVDVGGDGKQGIYFAWPNYKSRVYYRAIAGCVDSPRLSPRSSFQADS